MAEVKTGELVEQPKGGALENVPSWMEVSRDGRHAVGSDDIAADEIRLPRIGFAQGLSKEIIPGESVYIKGLALGEMFNNMSSENYGSGPIKFVPIKRARRFIEFIPRNEGGGIRDLNVPSGDPRTKWTKDENGQGVPPLATEFVEVVSVLLRDGQPPEPVMISCKLTNKEIKRSVDKFTNDLRLLTQRYPIYAGVFTITTKVEKNDEGSFTVPHFAKSGLLGEHEHQLYLQCKELRDQIEGGKQVVYDREGATPEGEGEGGGEAEGGETPF